MLEFKHFDVGISLANAQNIFNLCATKRINALSVVAHHKEVTLLASELQYNHVLGEIGVLILVDKHILKEIAIAVEYIGIVAQQNIHKQQNVVEIHSACYTASSAISAIDFVGFGAFCYFVGFHQLGAVFVVGRRHKIVFRHADYVLHRSRFIHLVVERHIFNNLLDKRLRIVGVVDGVVAFESYSLSIESKNFSKNRVKCAHPQFRSHFGRGEAQDALAHSASSLIGESKSHYIVGRVTRIEQMHYFICQHTSFAGTCSGNHKLRPVAVCHCRRLLGIELL